MLLNCAIRRGILLAVVTLAFVRSGRAADCDWWLRVSDPRPNPAMLREVVEIPIEAGFHRLTGRECRIINQTWNWSVTKVEFRRFNAPLGSWQEEDVSKVVIVTDGRRPVPNESHQIVRFVAGALDKHGMWRVTIRVEAGYASEDCGTCPRMTWTGLLPDVPVAEVVIDNVTFTSDHGVLRDYNDDFESGGVPFGEAEWWSMGPAFPITHTMDSPVSASVRVLGRPGNYRLRGRSLTQTFEETPFSIGASGIENVPVTSTTSLPRKIFKSTLSIYWEVLVTNSDGTSSVMTNATSANPNYTIAGKPIEAGPVHEATLRRMERAVQYASTTETLDPVLLLRRVMGSLGAFNASAGLPNAWYAPDPASARPTGQDWPSADGADCQTIVRFGRKVCYMVGLGGGGASGMTIEHVRIFAIETAPASPIESNTANAVCICEASDAPDCYWDLAWPTCKPRRTHPAHPSWVLGMNSNPDSTRPGGYNSYEACAKVTIGGVTKYYPGGVVPVPPPPPPVAVVEKNSAAEILKVFYSLAWFDEDNKPVVHIHRY